jgi:phosphatidylinositol kinase/protein kinase (PI-3  family)
VGGEVAVLPTKTRPKRLQLMGSDGAAYSFLLKARLQPSYEYAGFARMAQRMCLACTEQPHNPAAYSLLQGREDLRADARLMQVLRACRAALRAGGGDLAAMAVAQCFEVTPLGRRLGLIQVGTKDVM